jgi:hypothetical protein
MHFGGAMFFTDYSMSAMELAQQGPRRRKLTSVRR